MNEQREPLALTLEEALTRIEDLGCWLVGESTGSLILWRVEPDNIDGYSWPEVVSKVLGRPVVARDSAAELKAENERLRAALAGLYTVMRERHYGRMPPEVQDAYDKAGAALRGEVES